MEKRRRSKQHAITDEEFESLCIAIAQLSPRRRKVLILRIFYECSTQQIAERLDISLRTVHRDLARALEAVHATRNVLEVDSGSVFTTLIGKH